MGRYRALEVCKNIKRTLDRELTATCTKYSNSMFNKPKARKSILRKQLDKLLNKYNIEEKEL